MVKLLKALASGDISGAKSDLAQLKTDLTAQESADATKSLAKDMTSLLKDLASGDTSAAKSDLSKVQKDLQSEDASSDSSSKATNPLDSLISKMADSLSSGDVQGALQTLASYLVQNGQASGGLVNATA
jgi:DNA polymerase III delta subunit